MEKTLTLSNSIAEARKVIAATIDSLNEQSLSHMEMRRQKIEKNPRFVETEEYGKSMSVSYQIRRTMKDLQEAYDTLGNIWRTI